MKFIKDILLFDCITTNDEDYERGNILQISAVILDRNNLLERAVFNTYIKTSALDSTIAKQAHLLNVPEEVLKTSPRTVVVLRQFSEWLATDVTLACQHTHNLISLRHAFKNCGLPFPYKGSILELWGLEYIFSLNSGLNKLPTLETLADQFNYKLTNRYDAFDRVRASVHVLKKIIGNL